MSLVLLQHDPRDPQVQPLLNIVRTSAFRSRRSTDPLLPHLSPRRRNIIADQHTRTILNLLIQMRTYIILRQVLILRMALILPSLVQISGARSLLSDLTAAKSSQATPSTIITLT